MISTKLEYTCDREAWTGEPCNWTGTDPGLDDGGAIVYCPECAWIIEVDISTKRELVNTPHGKDCQGCEEARSKVKAVALRDNYSSRRYSYPAGSAEILGGHAAYLYVLGDD